MTRLFDLSLSRFSLRGAALLALSAAALLPSGAAQAAKGDDGTPELYFYPASGWKLEKSEQNCNVSSQFNNGFLMQISGSEKGWVKGLNINFRQDIFKAGQSYDVHMSVPGLKEQSLKATAINPQTLAMSLEDRKEFYKAMSKASVLDLSIEQNSFRFYLTGFTTYAEGFERCMAGSSVENALNPPPPDIAIQNVQTPAKVASEDEFKVNEAIAMEESVKRAAGQLPPPSPDAPITEISPENPEPVVQAVPVKEVKKLGNEVIDGSKTPEEIAESEAAALNEVKAEAPIPEPVLTEETKIAAAPEPIAEPTPAPALISSGPGLVNKNNLSPERVQQLLAQQMGEPAPSAPAEPEPLVVADNAEIPAPTYEADLIPMDGEAPEQAPVPEHLAADPMPAEPPAPVSEASPLAEPEPAPAVTTRMSSPEMIVNKQVASAEADFRQTHMPQTASSQVMLDKIGELEASVQRLKAENLALNNDLNSTLKDSEQERLSITSDNWNLEQATMRFNESERQVKRLGQELQVERARCSAEMKDLEASLFDPRITDQAQLARLAQLEQELAKAKDEIALQRMRYEEQIRALRGSNTTTP